MTLTAITLVLLAAVLHATWNYWAKRAGGGLPFVSLVGIIVCCAYVPVVAVYWTLYHPTIPTAALSAIFVSGVLKTGYSLFLQRGYRTGDFSLIYPLARGTGPLISSLGAVIIFGERPSVTAWLGGILIVASIFWLAGGNRWLSIRSQAEATLADAENHTVRRAAIYGLASGVFIASYTLWDKRGIGHLLIAPVLYDAGTAFTQLILLAPFAWKRRAEVTAEWRNHRLNAVIVAVAAPIGYVLILTAMRFTPVSYIAPAREVSILFGLFFGAQFLKEADARRRIWAAVAMVAGIVALAAG